MIADKIGRAAHMLLERVKTSKVSTDKRAGVSTEVADRLLAMERRNRELQQANEMPCKD